jgi:hypothetical protein
MPLKVSIHVAFSISQARWEDDTRWVRNKISHFSSGSMLGRLMLT